ncbi:MAG: hypothetical protein U0350_23000 [Caldilineaceae bacterium]
MKRRYTSLADFQDWELEAYADGEALPHVAAFFQEHPEVWAEWQRAEQLSHRLKGALHRFDCPSPEQLRDYFWQDLPAVERQTIAAHLAHCPHCTGELASMQDFMVDEPATPQAQPALNLPLPAVRALVQDVVERVRGVVATLVTPAAPQFTAIALRGEPPLLRSDTPTSLLFTTEDVDISLLVQKAANQSLRLAGQLFAADVLTGSTVKLIPADPARSPQQRQVDDTGNFVLEQLQPGAYQLVMLLPDKAIVLPELTLQ